jgi:hypothetical protein
MAIDNHPLAPWKGRKNLVYQTWNQFIRVIW